MIEIAFVRGFRFGNMDTEAKNTIFLENVRHNSTLCCRFLLSLSVIA